MNANAIDVNKVEQVAGQTTSGLATSQVDIIYWRVMNDD